MTPHVKFVRMWRSKPDFLSSANRLILPSSHLCQSSYLNPLHENVCDQYIIMTLVCFHFLRFYPCDPPYVTDQVREAQSFKKSMERMKLELDEMRKDLQKSVPFFSTRYKVG